MSAALSFEPVANIADGDFHFEQDTHSYIEGGVRRISLTQAISIVGLVDYRFVLPEVLDRAAWRGKMVHDATAEIDRGIDVHASYEIPEVCQPYVGAWELFCLETGFVPDRKQIEQPRIVTIAGIRVGMTPDVVGMLFGMPTVIERKTCSAHHPAWAIQTAGQDLGLPPPPRYRHHQRAAVQLLPSGKYKLWPYEDENDFEICRDVIRLAAWKLKNRLAKLG